MYAFQSLEGQRVELVPLTEDHIHPLFECAQDDRIWDHYPITIHSIEEMASFVHKAIAGRESGDQFPFAVWDKERRQYVGSTRFLRVSPEHENLNIGSTWYTPEVWRTKVNTECKYLMLTFAFEALNVRRVEIITSTDNVRSQKAIERLGATREGMLRQKYYGLDYIIYSILASEWPSLKQNLELRLK